MLFEMQFEKTNLNFDDTATATEDNFEVAPEVFKIYKEEIKVEVKQNQKKILTDEYVKVKDEFIEKKLADIITQDQNFTDKPVKIEDVIVDKAPVDLPPIPFNRIEKVPVFPGCEKANTNEERKKCFSKKVTKLIQKKFNPNLASDYGLSGFQRIYVQFKIDKTGKITEIKTRAPHSVLEKEAERVVKKIPIMKPGLQRGKPVEVLFDLPIVFKVED